MTDSHPLLVELKSICEQFGLNQGKAHLAFELYMELCEIHKLWDVNYYFNEDLKIFYLTGKDMKNSEEFNVYVPVTTCETLSVEYLQSLQETLSPTNQSLILVFKDRDSTSTYYRITKGLIRPDSPETSQRKKMQDQKYAHFQRFLTKWKKELFDKAVQDEVLEED